jgi:hypothetical protein
MDAAAAAMRSPGRAQRSPAAALAALKFALDHPLVDNEDVGEAPTHHLQVRELDPQHCQRPMSRAATCSAWQLLACIFSTVSLPPKLVRVVSTQVSAEMHVRARIVFPVDRWTA